MRTRKIEITAILVGALAGSLALAQNVIEQWGNVPTDAYEIYPEQAWIEILEPGGYEFKFWAHDGSGTPGTGIINNITVHPDATGDFSILIEHELGGPGALDWNEGDLRYDNGTSTATGVKVAGLLSEPGKTVWIDQLDGSIDVAGSVERLEIDDWVSPSPASIHVAGDVESLPGVWVKGPCAGDIALDGDARLSVQGNVSGSLDIGNSVYVSVRDIVDSADNHVRVRSQDADGYFTCWDVELSDDPDRWLTFGEGPDDQPIEGNVDVGEIRGVLWFRAPVLAYIRVGGIDAGPQSSHPEMEYGGIYFGAGTYCTVIVGAPFKQGWIYGSGSGVKGYLCIGRGMGQEFPPTVARILTDPDGGSGGAPTGFGWNVEIARYAWASLGSDPVVYAPGDLSGTVDFKCSLQPGGSIRVDGDIAAESGRVRVLCLHEEITVGGGAHGDIFVHELEPTARVSVGGDLTATVNSAHMQGTVEVLGNMRGKIEQWDANNTITGRIHVYGSLYNDQEGPEIWVPGGMDSGAAIGIDYDGWDEGDYWHEGATISIGGIPYDGNTWDDPQRRIWEIQHCKGDMNNNGNVDPNDPDLLTLAITDPEQYQADYPGLEGSLFWHGNQNCDDYLDEVDEGALAFFAQDPPCCLDDAECTE